MIGVICPSTFEYGMLKQEAICAKDVQLVVSGMGKVRSLYACHMLLQKYPKLDHILLIGFAGGLTDGIRIGDLVEANEFIEQDYFAEPFEKFPNRITRKTFKPLFPQSKHVTMLTQDKFLTDNPYKGKKNLGAPKHLACDMESFAVAHFCKSSNTPYHVVKLISDSADASATHDFIAACKKLAPVFNRTALNAVKQIRKNLKNK